MPDQPGADVESQLLPDPPQTSREVRKPTEPAAAVGPSRREVHLVVGDATVAAIMTALKPVAAGGRFAQVGRLFAGLLPIVQTLAIVGAAVWALREYVEFQREHQKLALDAQRIGREQASIGLAKSGYPRLQWTVNLNLQRADNAPAPRLHVYEAEFSLLGTNISDKELEVTYSIIQWFTGTLAAGREAILLSPPPPVLDRQQERSPLTWVQVGQRASVAPGARERLKGFFESHGLQPVEGGGATGRIRAGEAVWSSTPFVIQAADSTWVGFVANLGVTEPNGDGGDELTPRFFRKWQRLGSAHAFPRPVRESPD